MGENFKEEIFFFMYHMHIAKKDVLDLDPEERKWMINRFVEQKKRENEEIERAKAKAKSGAKHK